MRHLSSHLQGKTHVIWDWNGTLLNDLDLCVTIISDMAAEHGIAPITPATYLEIFRFPVIDYYKDVGFDFARAPFEELTHRFISTYKAQVREVPLFHGVPELLADLAADGIGSSVLSLAHEEDLVAMLRHHGIDGYFSHIYGLRDHYAASKVARGRQLLEALERPARELVLVGDTDHDLEVGQALGIDVLLLEGGHQHGSRLREKHGWVVERTLA